MHEASWTVVRSTEIEQVDGVGAECPREHMKVPAKKTWRISSCEVMAEVVDG